MSTFPLLSVLLLVALGFAVGAFGTLVGAGGGFILTPVLLLVYPQSTPALITAISLVAVFFNATSGTVAYGRQRRIDYRSGAVFAACTLPGSVLGVLVANRGSRPGFDVMMGVALGLLAGWLLTGAGHPGERPVGEGTARELRDREGHRYRYRARVQLGGG
jgi:uncharacterized protein